MRIMIANLTAACVAATLLTPTPASAWHDEPIYRYAAEYREAVRDFERSVIRSRHLNRVHERIVDDLEDATGRFGSMLPEISAMRTDCSQLGTRSRICIVRWSWQSLPTRSTQPEVNWRLVGGACGWHTNMSIVNWSAMAEIHRAETFRATERQSFIRPRSITTHPSVANRRLVATSDDLWIHRS